MHSNHLNHTLVLIAHVKHVFPPSATPNFDFNCEDPPIRSQPPRSKVTLSRALFILPARCSLPTSCTRSYTIRTILNDRLASARRHCEYILPGPEAVGIVQVREQRYLHNSLQKPSVGFFTSWVVVAVNPTVITSFPCTL